MNGIVTRWQNSDAQPTPLPDDLGAWNFLPALPNAPLKPAGRGGHAGPAQGPWGPSRILISTILQGNQVSERGRGRDPRSLGPRILDGLARDSCFTPTAGLPQRRSGRPLRETPGAALESQPCR